MARKFGLGKGLDALLPGEGETPQSEMPPEAGNEATPSAKATAGKTGAKYAAGAVVQLPTDRLVPNPGQPRKHFDEAELQELADSIKAHGIIQPVIAAAAGDGTYIIIAGERRTRAARLAGLGEVPAIIRD